MALLPFVQRQAIKRFRSGDAGPWGAVAAAAIGLRVMRHVGRRKDDVVYREVLKPGHEVHVIHSTDSRLVVAKADDRAAKTSRKLEKQARKAKRAGRSRKAGAVAAAD